MLLARRPPYVRPLSSEVEAEALSAHTSCGVFLECDQDGTENLPHS